ncbi:MAG: hypothetical protein DMG81_00795, partial [Acidobacteria bacterium]
GPDHPDMLSALQQLGTALAYMHRYPEAVKLFHEVIEKQGKVPNQGDRFTVWYGFGCVALAAGNQEEALQHLRQAIQQGYKDADGMMVDHDLAGLHNNPEFQQLVAELKSSPLKAQN